MESLDIRPFGFIKIKLEAKAIENTPHQISLVPVEEYYSKEGDEVFWNYRIRGGAWKKELTAYKQLPWVTFPPPHQEERFKEVTIYERKTRRSK